MKTLFVLFVLAAVVVVVAPGIMDSTQRKPLNWTNFHLSETLNVLEPKEDGPRPTAATQTATVTEQTEAPKPTAAPAPAQTNGALVNGMRPEFKEALDAYEAFFDEYVSFMKKYESSSNAAGMLLDYAKYLAEYTETMEKFDAMGDDDLNDAEMTYYLKVQMRVNQKLLETI